jgi:hypothetical protein
LTFYFIATKVVLGSDFMELLIVGFIASTIGLSYFIYGKKNVEISFLIFGLILMGYPYFVKSALVSSILGVVLIAGPFIMNKYWG